MGVGELRVQIYCRLFSLADLRVKFALQFNRIKGVLAL